MSCLCYDYAICPSITLVDCADIMQRKVEVGTWQDRSMSWLPACQSRPGLSCALWHPASNGSHIVLSQHLLSFLYSLLALLFFDVVCCMITIRRFCLYWSVCTGEAYSVSTTSCTARAPVQHHRPCPSVTSQVRGPRSVHRCWIDMSDTVGHHWAAAPSHRTVLAQ